MDIQMPRMDGFETTQKLRNDPRFRDVPIIALTSLPCPMTAIAVWMQAWTNTLSKPVNLKALTKTIQKLLSPEAGV